MEDRWIQNLCLIKGKVHHYDMFINVPSNIINKLYMWWTLQCQWENYSFIGTGRMKCHDGGWSRERYYFFQMEQNNE